MKIQAAFNGLILLGALQTIYSQDLGNLNKPIYVRHPRVTICNTDKIQDIRDFLDYVYEEDRSIKWFIDELTEAIKGEWFRSALNTQCVWLAYDENKAVGMAVLRVLNPWWDDLANGYDRMELQSLLVTNAMRSCGIGRSLYKVVENAAKAKGAKWLTLNAVAEAIPFYLKLGFEDARKTKYGFFMKKKLRNR
jgi:GNAT superfamily N-acetyltransferase